MRIICKCGQRKVQLVAEQTNRRTQGLLIILVFLFAISALTAGFQFSTVELLRTELEDAEETIGILEDEISTSQERMNNLLTRLDFNEQLAESYSDEIQSLRQKLLKRAEGGVSLPSDIIRRQMIAPSVRSHGPLGGFVGVPLFITVEIRPGTGEILINTEPRTGFDIQSSVRLAAAVAENITGFTLADRDIVVSIKASEVVEAVDGPSAGAALAVLMIAALEGKEIRADVMMTGTVESNGRIGPVGGITSKAEAAASAGASIFLVPSGQFEQTVFREVKRTILPGFAITTLEPEIVDLRDYAPERWGLRVVGVGHITEALRFSLVDE